jgi:hypothetical protein
VFSRPRVALAVNDADGRLDAEDWSRVASLLADLLMDERRWAEYRLGA